MKTTLNILLVCAFLVHSTLAALSGQPDYVGLTPVGNTFEGPYATLFEPSGKFFLTVRHWPFKKKQNGSYDHILEFGNGQRCEVKTIHYFSTNTNSYDIAIGELKTAVMDVEIPKVWWQMPQDLKQFEVEITGYSYLDGWYTGNRGTIYFNPPAEVDRVLAYVQPLVRGGYSGAPIFYQGKILGVNFGASTSGGVGVATLLFLVFKDRWSSFPPGIVSPCPTNKTETLVSASGSVLEIILRTPPGTRYQIATSEDLSQWIPVHEKSGFIESIPGDSQWETKVRWNTSSAPSAYFRAERQ